MASRLLRALAWHQPAVGPTLILAAIGAIAGSVLRMPPAGLINGRTGWAGRRKPDRP